MKTMEFGWFKNKWIWITAVTLLIISEVVFIYSRVDVQGTDLPQFDFDRIGGADNPTTDWDILQEALEILGQRSLQNKDGGCTSIMRDIIRPMVLTTRFIPRTVITSQICGETSMRGRY